VKLALFVEGETEKYKLNKAYKKPLEGSNLFRKLDPELAYSRCPHLQLLLDDILNLAKDAAVVR
jgi:hypothetical protein